MLYLRRVVDKLGPRFWVLSQLPCSRQFLDMSRGTLEPRDTISQNDLIS